MNYANEHPFFRTQATTNIKGRTVHGGLLAVAGTSSKFAIEILGVIVLARILGPENFGVFGLVWPLTSLFLTIGDLGLSMAIFQKSDLTHEEASTLFWLGLAVGCILAALCAALAPLLAIFYHDPRVKNEAIIVGLIFISTGLFGQYESLTIRAMQFKRLLAIDVIASFVALAGAIAAAFAGWGYWALVLRLLVFMVLRGILMALLGRWFPGRPRWRHSVSLIRFGANVTGANLLNYFAKYSDNILIGWRFGPAALGFYTMAYRILLLPIQQLTEPLAKVVVPVLSRFRAEPDRFAKWYYSIVQFLTFLVIPSMIAIGVVSRDFIGFLLGPKWAPSAEILFWLAPAGALQFIFPIISWALLSSGRSNRFLYWTLLSAPALVLGIVIGLHWGPTGVARGILSVTLFLLPLALVLLLRGLPVSAGGMVKAMAPSFLAAILVAVGLWAAQTATQAINYTIVRLLIAAFLTIAIMASVAAMTFGLGKFYEIFKLLKGSPTST